MKILGLDIGGANIKYALAKGRGLPKPRIIPFEIFRDPEKLIFFLEKIRRGTKPDVVSLTMTGELSDVFTSRKEGVWFIIDSVAKVFSITPLKILDTDGNLISAPMAKKDWERVASANWMATALWAAMQTDNCIVVDMGSTTTDIMPIKNGTVAVRGKTDLDRLKYGELIYRGYLRTNSATVRPMIRLAGVAIESCPEYFSIIGDAHLYLGDITRKQYTSPAPDGGSKTKRGAATRLARLVLSDPKTIGEGGIKSIAMQVKKAQVDRIAVAINKLAIKRKLMSAPVVLIGSGAIYKKWLSKKVKQKFVNVLGGREVSNIDPASCLAQIAFSCRDHPNPL